jgi:CpeT/CpcT family (DUF1001)
MNREHRSSIVPAAPRIGRVLLSLMACALALPACTTDSKLREQDLSRLRSWLPGHYDNLAQVEADIAAGITDVREPVAIDVVPVNPGIMGDTVFYVQQSDAMNPRRVLSQRLHRFEKGPDDEGLLHTILELKQPDQWLAAPGNPDVLRGIFPDDARAASGCALLWKFADGKFTATCPVAPTAPAGAASVPVELTQSELRLADLSFNGRARAVPSRASDPAYRFERR